MRIDVGSWKGFRVGDLFRLENPKGPVASNELVDGHDIPYIAASKSNNGVAMMCSRENIPDSAVMKGNCIVFIQQGKTKPAADTGYCTYSDKYKLYHSIKKVGRRDCGRREKYDMQAPKKRARRSGRKSINQLRKWSVLTISPRRSAILTEQSWWMLRQDGL